MGYLTWVYVGLIYSLLLFTVVLQQDSQREDMCPPCLAKHMREEPVTMGVSLFFFGYSGYSIVVGPSLHVSLQQR